MAKILQFPSARIQGLSFLEEQLRELLRNKGADPELMEFGASTVRKLYEQAAEEENYRFSLNLPDAVDEQTAAALQGRIGEGLAEIRRENHAIVVRLIAELALARVQLFQLQRDLETP